MTIEALTRRWKRPASLLGWSLLLGSAVAARAEPAARIAITSTPVPERDMPRLEATLTIEAPLERVRALLSDCNRLGEFMPGVEKAGVLSHQHETTRCMLVVDVPFPFGKLDRVSDRVAEQQPDHWRLSWQLVSGDFNYDEGVWELRPTPRGHTLVHYVALTRPKLPMPRGTLLAGQKDFIVDMLLRLRKRLLSSP